MTSVRPKFQIRLHLRYWELGFQNIFWHGGSKSIRNIVIIIINYFKDLPADILIESFFNFVENEGFKKVAIVSNNINGAHFIFK